MAEFATGGHIGPEAAVWIGERPGGDLYLAAERLGWTASDVDRFPAGALYLVLGINPLKETPVADLPPITLPFIAETGRFVATARTFVKHLGALADDLSSAIGEQEETCGGDACACAMEKAEPAWIVRTRSGTTEHVRALAHRLDDDGWLVFYGRGGEVVARFNGTAVESVQAA